MPQDLELLQGVWSIRSLDTEGQSMPADMLTGARITVKGDRFTSTGMGAEYAGKIDLDPLQSPRQIDMKFDEGPEAGNTNRGIYELDGDTWRLCLATSGAVRPADFSAQAGHVVRKESRASRRKGRHRPGYRIRRRVADDLRHHERQADGRGDGQVGEARDPWQPD